MMILCTRRHLPVAAAAILAASLALCLLIGPQEASGAAQKVDSTATKSSESRIGQASKPEVAPAAPAPANDESASGALDTQATSMHGSMGQMGHMMQDAVKQKTNMLMGHAQRGMETGNKMMSQVKSSIQNMMPRSAGKGSAADMMGSMTDAMMKSASKLDGQFKQHLNDHLSRLQSMQGMGDGMMKQMRGVAQTLGDGMMGTMNHLQQTGQKVSHQLEGGLKHNMKKMSGLMNSMQGSMGRMQNDMHGNFEGLMKHAQKAMSQMTGQLEQVVQGPMNMLQSIGSSFGKMMQKGGGGGGGGKSQY